MTTNAPRCPVRVPLPGSYRIDPAPAWTWLREHDPVTRARTVRGQEVWLVTRYELVRTVLADPRFSRAAAVRPGGPHAGAVAPRPGSLTAVDPPEHTRMRRLVAASFGPRRIERWRPWIAGVAEDLAGELAAASAAKAGCPADLRRAMALPLPLAVVGRLLGVPDADREHFEAWSDRLYSLRAPDPGDSDGAAGSGVAADGDGATGNAAAGDDRGDGGAYDALHEYLAELLAAKRSHPATGDEPDLLDDLVAQADTPHGLSSAELVGFAASLLVAGYETTASQLASFAVELLREPARWDRLACEPELVGPAVEELLRINRLSETGQVRVALEDVELGGVRIRAGDGVLAAIGPANRDPRAFPDPERYLPDRYAPGNQAEHHLTFGHGPHFCLGARLARIELVEALRALLARLPTLRLAIPPEQISWRETLIRGPAEVPVRW